MSKAKARHVPGSVCWPGVPKQASWCRLKDSMTSTCRSTR